MVSKTDATRAFELNFVIPLDFQVTLKILKLKETIYHFLDGLALSQGQPDTHRRPETE